jgi:hypothetical protein
VCERVSVCVRERERKREREKERERERERERKREREKERARDLPAFAVDRDHVARVAQQPELHLLAELRMMK